jgi:hypothetical protein
MTAALPTRYRDHTVIGTPAQIATLIANHTAAGTLVAATAARPLPSHDDRVRVHLRLAPTARSASPRRTVHIGPRGRRLIALAVAAAGAAAGATTAAAFLVGQLIEFITAHAALIVGVLAVAALAAAVIRSLLTTRRHCPGC